MRLDVSIQGGSEVFVVPRGQRSGMGRESGEGCKLACVYDRNMVGLWGGILRSVMHSQPDQIDVQGKRYDNGHGR